VSSAAVAPAGTGDPLTVASGDPSLPVAPAAKPASATAAGTAQPGADAQPQPQGAQPAPSLQQARAAATNARPGEQQPQQSAPAQATPVPTTSPNPVTAQPSPALPATTPVPLGRAAEAVENVIRLASARGVTHARIALRPAELGSVDVHLRSTAEGIVARVVAHSAETVQTLQHAAGDLRRSLEEQGLQLLSLDIAHSDERFAGRSGSDAGEPAGGHREADAPAGSAIDDSPTETTTLRLPNGVLVDVLA
jgi:flagellar hook-length control protein FliK